MIATPLRTPGPLLPIGEVSRRTGLAPSAIRYYEECGLVEPVQRAGGRRRFAPEVVARLRVVTEVQKAGFSLEEIRILLGPEGSDAETRRPLIRNKLAEVRRDIRRLRAIERALVAALDCGCDSLEHCQLPSLSTAAGAPGAWPPGSTTRVPSSKRRPRRHG